MWPAEALSCSSRGQGALLFALAIYKRIIWRDLRATETIISRIGVDASAIHPFVLEGVLPDTGGDREETKTSEYLADSAVIIISIYQDSSRLSLSR